MNIEKPFQTRSEDTGLCYFMHLEDAFLHAAEDISVHKISFRHNRNIMKFHCQEDGSWKFEKG